jgi:hypothetical protein
VGGGARDAAPLALPGHTLRGFHCHTRAPRRAHRRCATRLPRCLACLQCGRVSRRWRRRFTLPPSELALCARVRRRRSAHAAARSKRAPAASLHSALRGGAFWRSLTPALRHAALQARDAARKDKLCAAACFRTGQAFCVMYVVRTTRTSRQLPCRPPGALKPDRSGHVGRPNHAVGLGLAAAETLCAWVLLVWAALAFCRADQASGALQLAQQLALLVAAISPLHALRLGPRAALRSCADGTWLPCAWARAAPAAARSVVRGVFHAPLRLARIALGPLLADGVGATVQRACLLRMLSMPVHAAARRTTAEVLWCVVVGAAVATALTSACALAWR